MAATVGAAEATEAVGQKLAALLAGYGAINGAARAAQVPTIGVAHGTVTGCVTEHGVPMAGFDHEFTTTSLFSAGAQAFEPSRAAAISRAASLQEKVRVWARATGSMDRPLIERLEALAHREPAQIANAILAGGEGRGLGTGPRRWSCPEACRP